MCDYSLMHAKSRPAKVGDKLTTKPFGISKGFAAPEDPDTAVCLLPGTEVAFAAPVLVHEVVIANDDNGMFGIPIDRLRKIDSQVATFLQVHKDQAHVHHDALRIGEEIVLVTLLSPGQLVSVLQLPAAPKTADEAKELERMPITA